MTPKRKKRLQAIVFLLMGCAILLTLILTTLKQNIDVYYTPSDIHAHMVNRPFITVGGLVLEGSVVQSLTGKAINVEFTISDGTKTLTIEYSGILPDLFREGQGIIVKGTLLNVNRLKATQVLAKHDENYTPPVIKRIQTKANDTS